MPRVIHQDFPHLIIEQIDSEAGKQVSVRHNQTDEVFAHIVCNGAVHLTVHEPFFGDDLSIEDRQRLYAQIYGTAYSFSEEQGQKGNFSLSFQMGGRINPQCLSQLLVCTVPVLRKLYQ